MKKYLLAFYLATAALSTFAASITINDPSCSGYVATGTGGDLTISCSGSANPTPSPSPAPTPGSPSAPADNCTSQNLRNNEVALDWGAGTLKQFGMSSGQSYSFLLPVNAGDAGKVSTVYGGTQKIISISTDKCDFSPTLIAKNCLGGGSDPGMSYVAGSSTYSCSLTPGTTYYVNIRNAVLNGTTPIYPLQESCTGLCQFSIAY